MAERRGSAALLQWAGVACLAVAYLFLFARQLPYHMDEFLGFHALACEHYPHNRLNDFRSSCSGYDLAVWGDTYLPLRSYDYVGSLPGLLYWPLFRLFGTPWSARLLGPLALALQALLVHRLFGVRPLLAYGLLLLCMPYAFAHTVDFGTVVPQATAVFAVTFWTDRWLATRRDDRRISGIYPILAGATVFLAIWSKISFFFVVPGLALTTLTQCWTAARTRRPPRQRWRLSGEALAGALAALVPTLLLLAARDREGEPYARWITGSELTPFSDPAALGERFLRRFLHFVLNPLRAAHVITRSPDRWTSVGVALVALAVVLVAAGYLGPLARDRAARRRVTALLTACLLTVGLVVASQRTWAFHHLVLAAPFALLAGFEILSRLPRSRWRRLGVAAFLALNVVLHVQVLRLPPTRAWGHLLPAFNAELNREFAADHVIVLVDWGLYYVKSLYGPREQAVLHHWGLKRPAQLAAVEAVARELDRPLVFVGLERSSSDWDLIRSRISGLVEYQPSVHLRGWIALVQRERPRANGPGGAGRPAAPARPRRHGTGRLR